MLPGAPWPRTPRLLLEVNRRAGGDATRSPDALLAEVGLAEFAKAYPHELSGGMQQRVALVRAMALGAPLLLMDEPFAALDEITRADMRHLLARLCESLSTTIVFVTHSIAEAVFLSDRVVVLSNRPGRIVGVQPIALPRPRHAELEDDAEFFRADQAAAIDAARRGGDAVDPAGGAVVSTRMMLLASIVGAAVFGAIWELAVRLLDVREFILLPPSKIVTELRERPRLYFDASLVTGRHALLGVGFALAVALLLGTVLATSRFLEQAAQPMLILILVAPWVAYFLSIVSWLGSGDPPVLFLATFVAVPAFTFATVTGLRSGDPAARELLASVNASRGEVLWRLRLPSALPNILSTARYVVGLALAASYYGEGGNLRTDGLGSIGRRAASSSLGRPLWATVFATVILGVVGLGLVVTLERILLRWHVSQRRQSAASGAARGARRWLP